MKIVFKLIGILFAILFFISAGLQYNDPDAFVWIVIWGLAGIVSMAFVFDKLSFWIPILLSICYAVAFFFLYPPKFEGFGLDDGDINNVELAREAFGVLIMAVALVVYALRIRYVSKLKV